MAKGPEEWFKQAEYDMKTAEGLFQSGRYICVVFMCHLSIEKALKGLYQIKLSTIPPKVHNLLYFVEAAGITLPDALYDVVFALNRASIPTRYPENLEQMQKDYPKRKTEKLLIQSKEVLKWLKKELKK
ncbi:MAG: HEPN domain-containing protein [Pseudomonadota bacterium]